MRLNIVAAAAAFVLGIVMLGMAVNAEGADRNREQTFRQLELFGDILSRIESDYVQPVDDAELIEAAIEGMLRSLDPHSSYLNPDSFRDMQVATRGEYGGLGMEVTMRDDYVTVVAPFADTPAERAGIQTGDRIIGVDGDSLIGQGVDAAVNRMRGAVGEPVTITILRDGEEPFDLTLVRETIPLRSVAWRIEDGAGYLRVMAFNEHTTEALTSALADMRREFGRDIPGLVLDLRSNPGGLLDQAIGVTNAFLDGGEVVTTRYRNPRENQRYNARGGDALNGAPMVVLINNGSASASEIVAGALQDRERAVVVGMTSFGKGSVQTIIPLRGGRDGALRLTTGRYYTPSGRSIQATGIEPDIHIAARRITEGQRFASEGALPNALANENGEQRNGHAPEEIEQPPEGWDETRDYQLHRAVEILNARMAVRQAALQR
ncbi:MAG: S41 family peptidase [Maricaulaceae bacterium]|nr:S41 family peptidase [Maricaulaceae bacterium]